MRTSFRRTALIAPIVLVAALSLAGCTKDVEPPPTTVTLGKNAETVTVPMQSVEKTTYLVGIDNNTTYGQNKLEGAATVLGQPAKIQVLGNVEYIKGSGPFYGFLTVALPDGSLGFNIQGKAVTSAAGATALTSDMRFLGGSGKYRDAVAVAKFTGSRKGEVGAPIVITLTLSVTVPKGAESTTTSTGPESTAPAPSTTAAPAAQPAN